MYHKPPSPVMTAKGFHKRYESRLKEYVMDESRRISVVDKQKRRKRAKQSVNGRQTKIRMSMRHFIPVLKELH